MGFTHAENDAVVVGLTDALFGTVMTLVVPLKLPPPSICPVVAVTAVLTPLLAFTVESAGRPRLVPR
jgi:uncharacterized membrane protein